MILPERFRSMLLRKPVLNGCSPWVSYATAIFSAAAALFVYWLLQHSLWEHLGYGTVYGGVAFAIWFGRWKPGLVAAVIGFLGANYFFLTPGHALSGNHESFPRLIGYVFSCGIIIGLGELMHQARDRAEQESVERKRAQEAVAHQKDLLATTLTSIGDGVIVTDAEGRVTFLNPEAARLTGWTSAEAAGRPLPEVFRIINEFTREVVENPVEKVIRTGRVVGLANHTVLISKSGTEIPIDDSAAPIRHGDGLLNGIVLVFRDFSNQKKAFEANARLAAIVEYSGDAIMTKDLQSVIRTWNKGAERLFGYKAEEVIGKPITILFPPDRLTEEDHVLGRLRQGQPVERMETIRVTKDGRAIPVLVSVSPVKDPEGHVIGASKLVHDMTELVAARQELMQEKEMLATTLSSIGDAVIMTNANGRVTFLNGEAERLTKWTISEAAGRSLPEVFRIVNEETRQTVENPVEKVLRLGTVVGLANHTVLIAKDGTETPIDDSAAPIRQPGGPLFGVVLVFRDFTERKRAEEALQESENLFRALVSASTQSVWHYRREGGPMRHIQHSSESWWSEFTGQTQEELARDMGWLAAVHEEDREKALQNFWNMESASAPTSTEFRVRRHDGAWRWLLVRGIPLKFKDGQVVERAGTMTDITERKEAQEALREAHEQLANRALHLEELVQQRTARLNEMIGDLEAFSYSIVHDMRGPLRAMHSFTQLLQEECGQVSPTAENYMKRIRTAAARMDRLIQDGLNYSRLMRAELPLVPVDVVNLIRGIVDTYPTLQPPHVEIELIGAIPPVKANEAILTQCISNLLGNAVKFVAPGVVPRVRVRAETHGTRVRLFFQDNGIGIPVDAHERIFQIFQRLDNRYEGTGIGLAIVKKAAERMGGSVGLESEPGKGSAFWIELDGANVSNNPVLDASGTPPSN